ncbi:MAG: diguanylate cyclase [Desulfatiglandales bacterium]
MIEDRVFYESLLDNLYDAVYYVDRDRRITYWNRSAEGLTGYRRSEVLGRFCQDNILRHINEEGESLCEGQCPLAKTLRDGQAREMGVYLHHKDGHRVPVSLRIAPIRDTENAIIGAVEVFSDNSLGKALERRVEQLQKVALLDPLTSLGNRRYVEMNLRTKLDEMRRYHMPFGVLFMDIDRFKKINDTYGHDIGDEVLTMIGRTLSGNLRPSDLLGRWGGEEFVAIVANISKNELKYIANRCRVLVEQSSLSVKGERLRATISIGVTLCRPDDTLDSLMRRADHLMYQSKASGRNRVTFDETTHTP